MDTRVGQREGLLARLRDAAKDHVLDSLRIDAGATDQRIEHRRAKVGRMDVHQATLARAASGSADRVYDVRLGHNVSLLINRECAAV